MGPDGQTVLFDQILPVSDAFIKANISLTMMLGLPEIDAGQKHLTIVANGPSAGGQTYEGVTMALNGAIGLPCFRKSPPTYWCVSDPQGPKPGQIMPADFLPDDPPEETIYLVASKCHRSVFDKLKDRDVRLWHVDDVDWERDARERLRIVPSATSVTLTALCLAQRLGFRTIDTYGWDCCFGEGMTHHAGLGELGATASVITVRVGPEEGGRHFQTTPTWALEAQEAVNILPILQWAGCDVTIHGPGMVGAMANYFSDQPLQIRKAQPIPVAA